MGSVNNLVIGNSSQLGICFPNNFTKISSRDIDFCKLKGFDTIFITFAEQRTFNKDLTEQDFININVDYTSDVIDKLYNYNGKIIIYGTFELWNGYNGPVNIETPIKYNYSPYIKSKELLYNRLIENRVNGKWENVFIIHPVNFNSTNRKNGFLFSKIFDSIINNIKIDVGDLDINRDVIHTKYLIDESLICDKDMIVGSGIITNIKDFIKNIYELMGLNYNDYVTENISNISPHKNNVVWLDTNKKYYNLLKDTIYDIKKRKNSIS